MSRDVTAFLNNGRPGTIMFLLVLPGIIVMHCSYCFFNYREVNISVTIVLMFIEPRVCENQLVQIICQCSTEIKLFVQNLLYNFMGHIYGEALFLCKSNDVLPHGCR